MVCFVVCTLYVYFDRPGLKLCFFSDLSSKLVVKCVNTLVKRPFFSKCLYAVHINIEKSMQTSEH